MATFFQGRWKNAMTTMLTKYCLFCFKLFTCMASAAKILLVYHHIKPSWIWHAHRKWECIVIIPIRIWPKGHGSSVEIVMWKVWLVCQKMSSCDYIVLSSFCCHNDEGRVNLSSLFLHMRLLVFWLHWLVTSVVRNPTISFSRTHVLALMTCVQNRCRKLDGYEKLYLWLHLQWHLMRPAF